MLQTTQYSQLQLNKKKLLREMDKYWMEQNRKYLVKQKKKKATRLHPNDTVDPDIYQTLL
jgi:hypothetical protein